MTVSAETSFIAYVSDGATKVFDYPFRVDDADDLQVVDFNPVTTTEVVLTPRTISGIGLEGGGTVTLTLPITSTHRLIIRRKVPIDQQLALSNQRSWQPKALEAALDRITFIAQQLQDEIDSSFTLPLGSGESADDLYASLIALENSMNAQLGTLVGTTFDFDTRTLASAYVQGVNNPTYMRTRGGLALGDLGAALYKSVPDSGALLAGQFISNPGINQKRWENAENIITPAMFASINEMFQFTKGRIEIPAADYSFGTRIQIRANATVRCEKGARFLPTFSPVGDTARALAMIDIGNNAKVDSMWMHYNSGLLNIPIGFRVTSGARVGVLKVTATDYDKTTTTTDVAGAVLYERFGAVLVEGDDITVDRVISDNVSHGLKVYFSDRAVVHRLDVTNAIVGFNPRKATRMYIGSWNIEGVPYASQPSVWNTNGLIQGANNILCSGVQDSFIGPGRGTGALEHAIRLGGGPEIDNKRIRFISPRLIAPYGCGFKADDGDVHTNSDIYVSDLYVEDAGRDLSNGITTDWGNKEAVAIRNVERFSLNGVVTRALNYTYCGEYGIWIEKSNKGSVFGADVQNARYDGIRLTPNGYGVMTDITVKGRSSFNGQDGVSLTSFENTDTAARISLDVDSFSNAGFGFRMSSRPDTTAGYNGPIHIKGLSSGNTSGEKTVGVAPAASVYLFDSVITGKPYLQTSTTYNPGSIAAGAAGAPTTVTVTGAAVGDLVLVSGPGASGGLTWVGTVTAADTVSVCGINPTASAIDAASNTLIVRVYKQ